MEENKSEIDLELGCEEAYVAKINTSDIKLHLMIIDYKADTFDIKEKPLKKCDFTQFGDPLIKILAVIPMIYVTKKDNRYYLLSGEAIFNILKIWNIKECRVIVLKDIKTSTQKELVLFDQHFSWLINNAAHGSATFFIKSTVKIISSPFWSQTFKEIAPDLKGTKVSIANFLDVAPQHVFRVIKGRNNG